MQSNRLSLGANPAGEHVALPAQMANRHGLIAGATGTGKTVTLQVLDERFSENGVPVFTADVQGAGEAFLKSMLRSVGSTLGRRIVRGILGSITGGR